MENEAKYLMMKKEREYIDKKFDEIDSDEKS